MLTLTRVTAEPYGVAVYLDDDLYNEAVGPRSMTIRPLRDALLIEGTYGSTPPPPKHPQVRDRLKCLCWCGYNIVDVTPAEVRAGITHACRDLRCG